MSAGQVIPLHNAVVLSGSAIDVALYAVRLAQRYRARNDLPPLLALEQMRATMSPLGQSDGPEMLSADAGTEAAQVSLAGMATTQEAAKLLGCGPRQARRLAPMLGGRLAGGRWLLDREAIREHCEGRAAR